MKPAVGPTRTEMPPLPARTGNPAAVSPRTIRTASAPYLAPRMEPASMTASVCSVIGTVENGRSTFMELRAIMTPAKSALKISPRRDHLFIVQVPPFLLGSSRCNMYPNQYTIRTAIHQCVNLI
ncbi:hypothetical protein D3C71_1802420 [compost metagenome]